MSTSARRKIQSSTLSRSNIFSSVEARISFSLLGRVLHL